MTAAAGHGAGARAVITGVTGQDGSFLSELLLEQGYEVTGVVRRDPHAPLGCAEHLRDRLDVVELDLLDAGALGELISRIAPRELYHLASPSFVPQTWDAPAETVRAIAGATAVMLETVRAVDPSIRVLVATSSAIFGEAPESPQNERTPCNPINPYGVAKLAGHQLTGLMRARDGLHATSAIFYNHESERRPAQFVTRKITRGAAAIKLGLQEELWLGDLDAIRDWAFAGDLMEAAWLALQQDEADDYVLASGVGHTVREFVEAAFGALDLEPGPYIRQDPALLRGPESTPNVGDTSHARRALGWEPRVSLEQLVERMVRFDLAELSSGSTQPAAESSRRQGR